MTTVSVVTAVLNGEPYIAQALRSALQQTHAPIECIVVDGGSTDGTEAAVASIDDDRIRFVRQKGTGASSARNEGFALAGADVIALLDSDDVWYPTKLERQLLELERNPSVGLVACGYAILNSDLGEWTSIVARDLDLRRWLLHEGNGLALTSTGLFRAAVLDEVGGFDEELPYNGDLDLALRIADRHPVAIVDEILVGYRLHPGQLHLNPIAYEHDSHLLISRRLGEEPMARARATANLYTRLFVYDLHRKRFRWAVGRLPKIGWRVDRFVLLPVEGALRRIRRVARQRRLRRRWDDIGL